MLTVKDLSMRFPIVSDDLFFNITDTTIYKVHDQTDGGAINILGIHSTMHVLRCLFYKCSATNKGGAISFFGEQAFIEDSCFVQCYTQDTAFAFEIYTKGKLKRTLVARTTLFNCSYSYHNDDMHFFDRDVSNIMEVYNGIQKFSYINSSHNEVAFTGGFLWSDSTNRTDLTIEFCSITYNACDCLFNLYSVPQKHCTLQYCNVLNTMPSSETLCLFDLEDSSITVHHFSFVGNNMSLLAANGELAFQRCVTDFDTNEVHIENCKFTSDSSFQWGLSLQKISRIPNEICKGNKRHKEAPNDDKHKGNENVQNILREESRNKGGVSGFTIFIIVVFIGAIGAIIYFMLYDRNNDLNTLYDVKMI